MSDQALLFDLSVGTELKVMQKLDRPCSNEPGAGSITRRRGNKASGGDTPSGRPPPATSLIDKKGANMGAEVHLFGSVKSAQIF